jgi:hypothetical protein
VREGLANCQKVYGTVQLISATQSNDNTKSNHSF